MLNADAAHSVSVSHGSAGGQVGNAAHLYHFIFGALVFGHGHLTVEPCLDSENSYFSGGFFLFFFLSNVGKE